MSTPVSEVTIRRQRLGAGIRRKASKRRKKLGKAPLRSAFRKLPAATRARLSRARSKFMKRFGKKIAALRSSYDFPATLTGTIKHRPEYVKMILEGANIVCEDHEDAREFAKLYLDKDPAFSNTDTGMAALLFEVKLVEFTGGLYGVFMETIVHGNEPTFMAMFEGKLRKEELERFANDIAEFCTFQIMVRAGQASHEEGSVSDLTILECVAVTGAKSYKLPPSALAGGAQRFTTDGGMPGAAGKPAANYRMLPRTYEGYERVVEDGGMSDAAFRVLYAHADHESNGNGIGRAVDHNDVPWLCHEGVWVPDLETMQERDVLADYEPMDDEVVEHAVFRHLNQRVDEGSISSPVACRIHTSMVERAGEDPNFLQLIQEGLVQEAARKVAGRPVVKATPKSTRLRNANTPEKRLNMTCDKCVYYDPENKGNCTILEQKVKPKQTCDAYARTAVVLKPKKVVVGAVSTPLGTLAIVTNPEGFRYSAVVKESLDEGEKAHAKKQKARGHKVVLVLPKKEGAPLYFKTSAQASKMSREEYPNAKIMPIDKFIKSLDEASSSSQDDYILVDGSGVVIKYIMPMKINPEEVAVENARLKSRGINGKWVHYTRVLRGEDRVTRARVWYKSPLPEGSGSMADDYVMVDSTGRIVATIMPMKIQPEDVPKENKRLKERGINGQWVHYTKVTRGAGGIHESSGSMEDDYILVNAAGKPVPGQSPQKLAPEEAKAMTKARKDGHKYVRAFRSQLEALDEARKHKYIDAKNVAKLEPMYKAINRELTGVEQTSKPVKGRGIVQRTTPLAGGVEVLFFDEDGKELGSTHVERKTFKKMPGKRANVLDMIKMQKESLEESSSSQADDYVLVDGRGNMVPNFSPQKLTPEEVFERNRLLPGGMKYVLALRSKLQGAAHVSSAPPTRMKLIGEGTGLRRKPFPIEEGYQHVHFKGSKSIRAKITTSKMGAVKKKSVQGRTFGKWLIVHPTFGPKQDWAVSHIKTGLQLFRHYDDRVVARLAKSAEKYGSQWDFDKVEDAPPALKTRMMSAIRAAKAGPGGKMGESEWLEPHTLTEATLYDKTEDGIASKFTAWCVSKEGTDDGKTLITIGTDHWVVDQPLYEVHAAIQKIAEFYGDLPEEFDTMVEAFLRDFCGEEGAVAEGVDAVSIGLFETLGERGRDELKAARDDRVQSNSRLRLLALNGVDETRVLLDASQRVWDRTLAEAKGSFKDWLKKVDRYVERKAGMSLDDLPDVPARDWYDDGVSPQRAAAKAIKMANESIYEAVRKGAIVKFNANFAGAPIKGKTARIKRVSKTRAGANEYWVKPKGINTEIVLYDTDFVEKRVKVVRESLDEGKDVPPGVGPDPTKWSKSDQKKVIAYYAKWPLKKLRRHQDLIMSQQKRAGSNKTAMARLQMIERLLAAAVDKREFAESLNEAVFSTADASELSQAEALKLIKKSGLSVRVIKKTIRTTGGMRKSTTVMLKSSKVDDETYDIFLDLRTNTGGEILKGTKAKWVDVGGKDQYASFRAVHGTDVPESLDESLYEQKASATIELEGKKIKVTEPTHLKALASKAGVSVKRALRLWGKAQIRVMDQYPNIKKKSARYYQAATGIMKKMMKLPTEPLSASEEAAECFIIEQVVTPGSMANWKAVMAAARKKPKLSASELQLKKAWTDMVDKGILAPGSRYGVGDLYQYEPIFWSGSQGTVMGTVGSSVDAVSTLWEATTSQLKAALVKARRSPEFRAYVDKVRKHKGGKKIPEIAIAPHFNTKADPKVAAGQIGEATRSTSLLRKAGINAKTGRFPMKMRHTRDLARGPQKYGRSRTRYGEQVDDELDEVKGGWSALFRDKKAARAFKKAAEDRFPAQTGKIQSPLEGQYYVTWDVTLPKQDATLKRLAKKMGGEPAKRSFIESINESDDPADPVSIKEVLAAVIQAEGRIDYNVFVQSFEGHKQASINGAIAELVDGGFMLRQSHTEHGNTSHDLVMTPQGFEKSLKLNEDGYQHDMLMRVQANLSTTEKMDDDAELFWRAVLGEDASASFDEAKKKKLNPKYVAMGRRAFHAGTKAAPVLDKAFMKIIAKISKAKGDIVGPMTAWSSGWHAENVAAPVPESLDEDKIVRDALKVAVHSIEDEDKTDSQLRTAVEKKLGKKLTTSNWNSVASALDRKGYSISRKGIWFPESIDEADSPENKKLAAELRRRGFKTNPRMAMPYVLKKGAWELRVGRVKPPMTKGLASAERKKYEVNATLTKKNILQAQSKIKRDDAADALKRVLGEIDKMLPRMTESLDEAVSQVAKTIQQQIGRKAFVMMGAKQLLGGKKSLMWSVGKNPKGVTKVRVTLTTADEYNVEFIRIRKKGGVPEAKVLKTEKGVQVDNLRAVIEDGTGMRLSL